MWTKTPEFHQHMKTQVPVANEPSSNSSPSSSTSTSTSTTSSSCPSSTLFPSLQSLEFELRCTICREFFDNPVSIQDCGHTFCSYCLRGHAKMQLKAVNFNRKVFCPTCRIPMGSTNDYENYFQPNASIQRVAKTFASLRSALKQQLLAGASVTTHQPAKGIDDSTKLPASLRRSTRNAGEANAKSNGETGPSPSHAATMAPLKRQNPYQSSEDASMLPSQHPTKTVFQRKRRPTYHVLKLGKLKQLLSEEGLDSTGTAEELTARHERFVMMYNSKIDTHEDLQMTEHELHQSILKKLQKEETARRREQQKGWMRLESEAEQKDKQKDLFDKLVEEGRRRRAKEQQDSSISHNDDKVTPVGGEQLGNKTQSPTSNDARTADNEKVTSEATDPSPSISRGSSKDLAEDLDSSPDVEVVVPPTINSGFSRKHDTNISSKNPYRKRQRQSDQSTQSTLIGPWECPRCTFRNTTLIHTRATCEMCQSPRNASLTNG